jgi:dimethylaniline monooxygenase (N-oxide forming)
MAYPDFLKYGTDTSYLPAADVLKYLRLYADTHDVIRHVKFNHNVILVKPRENIWVVAHTNLLSGNETIEEFDAVMVCNGHYHTPNTPNIKGLEHFKGFYLITMLYD